MLRACGIVAEYNPFHNGHAYHVAQTKQHMKSDVVIAIMSGNFVQRGELACVNKWERASVALQHGIDIVVELPVCFSVQAADYFAYGAMKIAQQLGVSELSFGIENDVNVSQLWHVANQTLNTPKRFDNSYAKQWQMQEQLVLLPNQQLAISYLRACLQLDLALDVLSIQRLSSLHTDTQLPTSSAIASATAIRKAFYLKEDVSPYVSYRMYDILKQQNIGDEPLFFALLKYQLSMQTPKQLQTIYQMVEGIEHVLKREIVKATNYTDFLKRCQSKRFNQKRLQRLCLYVVLQLTKDMVQRYYEDKYSPIRVLGFSPKGRDYLKQLDSDTYVTQLKKSHVNQFDTVLRCDSIYEQLTQMEQQNFRKVVRVNEAYSEI